jgi:hypothetical protein
MQTIQSAAQAVMPMLQWYIQNDAPQQPYAQAKVANPMVPQDEAPIYGYSDPAKYGPGYPVTQNMAIQPYIVEPGNIDLSVRQLIASDPANIPNKADIPYSYGSEYSARDKLPNGNWMTYPTIYNGKNHGREEAFQYAKETGKHMGIIKGNAPEAVINEYENVLHSRDISLKDGRKLNGDVWKEINGSK